MVRLVLIALALGLAGPALAQSNYGYTYGTGSNPQSHEVEGYTRNNGTYVQPHYQTNPNNTQMDNYGSQGNYNPNNGAYGTRAPRY